MPCPQCVQPNLRVRTRTCGVRDVRDVQKRAQACTSVQKRARAHARACAQARARMAARAMFALKSDSKFNYPSEPQAQALAAICATQDSGIVELPCGTGKTMIALRCAAGAGRKHVLFLNFEQVGAVQVVNAIREHTTVNERHICLYTTGCKTEPNKKACYMVTTYAMFSAKTGRSDATERVRQFVLTNTWDLVVLDECHHAWAKTFRELVERLAQNARRVIGFTGTLCRNEPLVGEEDAHHTLTRQEANEKQFAFIGRVLYSRTCAEMEAEGLIAKVRRLEVDIDMTIHFAAAHAQVAGPPKQYLQALNPEKLNAVWMLVELHHRIGDIGMIFVNHLLPAKTIKAFLGARWEVLAGGNAHGTDGTHTARSNAELVRRFNAGELDGLIATPVGESALDVYNARFRYAIVVDAHSGHASAAQKLGRLSRTPRLPPDPGESAEAHAAHLRRVQKRASYYEIVTRNTEETSAARARDVQFLHDGYDCAYVDYAALRARAAQAGIVEADAPFATAAAQLSLLVECLSYQDLGHAECAGNAKAAETLFPHQREVKRLKAKVHGSTSALFRERHQQRLVRTQALLPLRKAEARAAKRGVMERAPLPEAAASVLRALDLDADLLASADIALPSSPPPPPEIDDSLDD